MTGIRTTHVRVYEAGASACVYARAFKKVSCVQVGLMSVSGPVSLPTYSQIAAFLHNSLELCRKAGHFAIYSTKSALTWTFPGGNGSLPNAWAYTS